ncbi:MAG TPA: hypothetical protein VK178_09965 [Opitutaceae bacterium]|nr:hypothetical protein [Opitutaceae bacterium]
MTTASPSVSAPFRPLDLAGRWRIVFGNRGTDSLAPSTGSLAADIEILLPATTETAGLGSLNAEARTAGLTPVRRFVGPVWYEREFTAPEAWRSRPLRLLLERTKHTTVWVDGRRVGSRALLTAPHEHDLGPLSPGEHRLTLCVDNSLQPAPGDNHQISEHTQGNWNGVLGRLEVRALPPVRLEHIAVTSDLVARAFQFRIRLSGPAIGSGSVAIAAESGNHAGAAHHPQPLVVPLSTATLASGEVTLTYPLGAGARLWDEFSPALYGLTVRLETPSGIDERTLTTGLREFRARGTQFAINGRTTFLRGEVNCCVFPLTGHPPMEVAGWRDYFRVLLEHGLNHVRFHSWTPPDAAFTAADELGLYVQTELPFWGEWNDSIRTALFPEGQAILRTYGHHPSFVALTLGNEHRGDRAPMSSLVATLRALDPSRLYAEGSNNFLTAPAQSPADDLWITARVPDRSSLGHFANVRGCHATPDGPDGHLQIGSGGTRHDYSAAIAGIQIPVVSHEIGQFSIAPNFHEIPRYTGVFAARNLAHYREKCAAAGLLADAPAAHRASAKLVAQLYREEIEAALRTPGFGGFQLLGLQDFPGQGTALVGLYNALLESKGAITPEEFRRFCAPHVLLARFDRHTWTAGEIFSAHINLAHYGPVDLPGGTLTWALIAPASDTILATGTFATLTVPSGGLRRLGELRFPLPAITSAQAVELRLSLTAGAESVSTEYPLWLYTTISVTETGFAETVPVPATPEASSRDPRCQLQPPIILRTSSLSSLVPRLASGSRVLLLPDAAHPFAHSPGGAFMSDFWCWTMFHNKPGTLGLLIDNDHPALAGFPTAEHSDWQWFHLAQASQSVVLDSLPRTLRPIVRVIDNFDRCHSLGLIFEVQVGPGCLLVCAIDLPALAPQHPEACQLLASLRAFIASDRFAPTVSVEPATLAAALETSVPFGRS